jgi:hypothetical protein
MHFRDRRNRFQKPDRGQYRTRPEGLYPQRAYPSRDTANRWERTQAPNNRPVRTGNKNYTQTNTNTNRRHQVNTAIENTEENNDSSSPLQFFRG